VVGPPLAGEGGMLDSAGLVEAGRQAVRRLRAVAKDSGG
jgi:hypothetical protein